MTITLTAAPAADFTRVPVGSAEGLVVAERTGETKPLIFFGPTTVPVLTDPVMLYPVTLPSPPPWLPPTTLM